MKARESIMLALVLSLALVPMFASAPVRAQGQYTERLDVYTAGSNAYWLMTLNRLNSTVPNLASAESSAGLSAYRLVALSTQAATSDLQVFGIDGYNVLHVPSMPSQGLFLTVNASSSSAAAPVVSFFGNRFATAFTLVSSGSGSYVYFAPADFTVLAAPVLYKLVPTTMKGFASFLTEASFVGLAMPSVALTGVNNGSGFSHSITIGAAASSILNSTSAINVPEVLSNANGVLTASSSSSSSEVVIHSLDGVVQSTGKATVSNDASNLSGTYTLSVSPGSKVKVNATILSQAPTAIAYREFDRGTLTSNQSLAVTIVMKNTAESGSITNFALNDNWWQSYPTVFQYVSGNYSFTLPSIPPGQNMTESYVLKVISTSSLQVTVPATTATFQYLLSTTSYSSRATLNQAVLQVNSVGPAISMIARPTISSGAPLGTAGNFTLTLSNNGNSPALNLKVGGYSFANLAQGSTQTVSIPISMTGLMQNNLTRSFSVSFTNSAQQTSSLVTNSVSLIMSHSSMVIPFVQLSTSDTLTAGSIASRALNVTYTFANSGAGVSGTVTGTQALPAGVSCKVVSGTDGVCSSGNYSIAIPALTAQDTQANTLELSFSRDNFVIQPASMTTSYEGATLHTFGGAYVIPGGIAITKTFGSAAAFPGMTSPVYLAITNFGSGPVYNATLSSNSDSFDSLAAGTTATRTYASLAAQQNENFNYTVAVTSGVYGNESSSAATVTVVVGGLTVGFSSAPAYVKVFRPVSVTLTTSPSTPEENHDFTISVTFTNPASVAVTGATYAFTIPSGLKVLSGATASGQTVTVSVPSLGADSNQTVAVTATASAGVKIDTTSSHVTFEYQGVSIAGLAPRETITVGVDVTTRYTLPIIVAVLIALAGLVYLRRRIDAPVAA
jgi:hypothetical protein